MATYKPVLHHRPKADGTRLIMIRITKDRKVTYLSTSYYIKEKEWNNGKVRATNEMHEVYNAGIKKIIRIAEEAETKSNLNNQIISGKGIKNKILTQKTGTSFKKVADKHLKDIAPRVSPRTPLRYSTHLNKLYSHFSESVTFEELTEDKVKNFINWLYKEYKQNTINRLLKTVKCIFDLAIDTDLINTKNPFKNITVGTQKVHKERLTKIELETIEKLNLPPVQKIIRDIFMIQYYTGGTRISDILRLRKMDIKDGHIQIITDKGDKPHQAILVPQALKILDQYIKPLKPKETVFPFMRNFNDTKDLRYIRQLEGQTSKINAGLKTIGKKAKISKVLTTHLARHTFADHMRQNNASIYTISKALTHSNIRTTELYMETFDQKAVDEALINLFDNKVVRKKI